MTTPSRERQERISRGAATTTTQPIPTAPLSSTAPSGRTIGIIRLIDPVAGVIKWQRIRYKDNPPKAGEYEAFGDVEDGYPLELSVLGDYAIWVWGEAPPDQRAQPVRAERLGGSWILSIIFKPDGSELPADEPMAGCSG